MKYFTIQELTRSETAIVEGINNNPGRAECEALEALVDKVLDPLREAWGMPISVNSGYRCPEVNKAVGGTPNSQHLKGQAADITTGTKTGNRRLFDLAIRLDLPFDQLIDERGYTWLHISYRPHPRKQVLHL